MKEFYGDPQIKQRLKEAQMRLAEQNMMGFAAGLAREGFFPYIHTFAVFVTRRPFAA